MQLPSDILVLAFEKASANLSEPIVNHPEIFKRKVSIAYLFGYKGC